MCQFSYDLLVNVLGGVVYGLITWLIIARPKQRQLDKENFENGKQNYQRYIEQISIEIKIAEGKSNFDDIVRLIGEDPITPWGNRLTEEGLKKKTEIRRAIEDIGTKLSEKQAREELLTHVDVVRTNSELFKYRLDVLKMAYSKKKIKREGLY